MNLPPPLELARATLLVVGVVVLSAALVGLLYATAELFLLLFVGVLFALLLRAVARPLERWHLSRHLAFALAALLFFLVIAALLLFFGPPVLQGFSQLAERLPDALDRLGEIVGDNPQLGGALEEAARGEAAGLARATLARLAGIFSTLFGAVVAGVVVLFVGFYFAAEPGLYREGLLRLVPPRARGRAGALLDELGWMLTWWILAQFISMATVGVLTWLGLLALGLPFAGTLALAAALLTFIPTIGPILSAIPAVLVALMEGPLLALYVVLLYVVVQSLESYLVTPLVQRRVVKLPPVLVVGVQLLLAVLYGMLGLFAAAPLTVAAMVLVKRLYVEGVLGDRLSE